MLVRREGRQRPEGKGVLAGSGVSSLRACPSPGLRSREQSCGDLHPKPGPGLGLHLPGPFPGGGEERSPHLEELHPNAGEHELKQRGDNHDVPDGPDGDEHALHHVLRGEGRGVRRGLQPEPRGAVWAAPSPQWGAARRGEGPPQVLPGPTRRPCGLAVPSSPHPPLSSGQPPSWVTLMGSPSPVTFRPLALLMARRGLRTRRTRKIFTTLMALDLGDRDTPGAFGEAGRDMLGGVPAGPVSRPTRT